MNDSPCQTTTESSKFIYPTVSCRMLDSISVLQSINMERVNTDSLSKYQVYTCTWDRIRCSQTKYSRYTWDILSEFPHNVHMFIGLVIRFLCYYGRFFYLNAEFVLKFLTSRCSLTVIMDFVHSYGTWSYQHRMEVSLFGSTLLVFYAPFWLYWGYLGITFNISQARAESASDYWNDAI